MKQTGHKRDMPVMVRRKMGLCSAQLPFKSTGGGLKGHLRGGGGQKERHFKKNHVSISPKSRRPSQANTGAIHCSEAKEAGNGDMGEKAYCSCVR